MKNPIFWMYLSIISALTLAGLYFVHTFEVLAPHFTLSIIMFGLMFLTTVLLFYFGKAAANSENKYRFIHLSIGSVMAKIFLVILVLVVYVKNVEPDNRLFILPFISIYLIFSIFETIVLYRLALSKTKPSHE